MIHRSPLFVVLFALVACKSAPPRTVPAEIVTLYDLVDPAGKLELEIDRDGKLREAEAEVKIETLPTLVVEAALDRARGGTVTGAEREYQGGAPRWEVKVLLDGRNWEFVVDEKGNLVETEQELAFADAPPLVLDAAQRRVPGGSLRSVELIERGNWREYHVKSTRDGANFKLVVAPDGRVLRAVREQPAEIEIPLK